MERVRLIKTLNEEEMPIGRTGSAEKWNPPGMVIVHWDFGPTIPMYYNEIERINTNEP